MFSRRHHYAAETWTITKSLLSRLDAFQMWIYRRVLEIYRTAKMFNEELSNEQNTGATIQDEEITISRTSYKI